MNGKKVYVRLSRAEGNLHSDANPIHSTILYLRMAYFFQLNVFIFNYLLLAHIWLRKVFKQIKFWMGCFNHFICVSTTYNFLNKTWIKMDNSVMSLTREYCTRERTTTRLIYYETGLFGLTGELVFIFQGSSKKIQNKLQNSFVSN